jgi:hypothetical protein
VFALFVVAVAGVGACLAASSIRAPQEPAPGTPLDLPDPPGLEADEAATLETGTSLEILALHPHPHEADGKPAGPEEDFHGYRILGRGPITDPGERRRLLEALYDGLARPAPFAACFIPRHGIRAVAGAETIDLVVCFECDTVQVHSPGRGERPGSLPTSRAPEPAFDEILAAHGLEKHGAR